MKKHFGVVIERISSVLPSRTISNELLIQGSHFPPSKSENILSTCGVGERRKWDKRNFDSLSLCESACRSALQSADLADVGMIYFNTSLLKDKSVRHIPTPADDIRVRLDLPEAGAISATGGCPSFLALVLEAAQYVSCHRKKALVVGIEDSEVYARSGVPQLIFGDACIAILLSPTDQPGEGFLAFQNALHLSQADSKNCKQMHDALVVSHEEGTYGAENLFMNGGVVKRFTETTFSKTIESFLSKNNIKSNDIDVFVPHQANISLMKGLKERFFHTQEMAVTVDTRGNNSGLSSVVALHKCLTENHARKRNYFICAFGSGPGIACAYYASTGKEFAASIDELEARLEIQEERKDRTVAGFIVPNESGHRPFILMAEEDFDRSAVSGAHKLLVQSQAEAEFFLLALKNQCGIFNSPGMQKIITEPLLPTAEVIANLEKKWDPAINSEVVLKCFDRIQVKNSLVETAGIAWSSHGLLPEKIANKFVHKSRESNVLLSKNFQIGNLNYFNMYLDTEELKFDHASEHVQGMLLIEGARQAGLATTQIMGLSETDVCILDSVDFNFRKFVSREHRLVIRTFATPIQLSPEQTKKVLIAVQIIQQESICVSGSILTRCVHAATLKQRILSIEKRENKTGGAQRLRKRA